MASPLRQWTLGYLGGFLLADALRPSLGLARWLSLGCLLLLGLAARRPALLLGLPLAAVPLGLWAHTQSLSQGARSDELPAALTRAGGQPWLLQGVVRDGLSQTAGATLVPLSVWSMGRLDSAGERRGAAAAPSQWQPEPALAVDLYIEGPLHEPLLPGDAVRAIASLRLPSERIDVAVAEGPAAWRSGGLRAYAPAGGLLRLAEPSAAVTALWLPSSPRLWLRRSVASARIALLQAHAAAWRRLPGWLSSAEVTPPTLAALQLAMSLGDRGPLRRLDAERTAAGRPALEALLRAAGVYHILSVSGLHLSLVGLCFYALARWAARRAGGLSGALAALAPEVSGRWAALLTMPIVLGYTLLTGAEPPTVRAAIALLVTLFAKACGRRARLSTGLALAVLWSALPLTQDSDPQSVFAPSLVLSFAATLGIAYLRPLGRLPAQARPPARTVEEPAVARRSESLAAAVALLLRLCAASLAALLATAPLLAYYFAEFQGSALLGNLLVTPLAELGLLPSGLLAALLALIWPPLALPIVVFSSLVGQLSLWLATQVAALGLGCQVAAPSRGLLLLWYLGLGLWRWRPRCGVAVVATTLLAYLLLWWWPNDSLRIRFLSVGQGDAAVAELPGGAVVVIDTGWPPRRPLPTGEVATGSSGRLVTDDAAAKTAVAQELHRRGHRRIDLLIVSHRHPDHMGGAASLLRQFAVDVLWLSRQPASTAFDPHSAALRTAEAELIQLAQRVGTLVAVPHSLRLAGVALDVLSPCPSSPSSVASPSPCRALARGDWEENDNSLVVALRYRGRTVLFTGDIESAAEQALLLRGVELRADILKLPHHGSRTSSSEALLRAVAPRHAIASLGQQNRFGFPHPQVIARLAERQIPLWRTDRDGTIEVEISAAGQLQLRPQHRASHLADYLFRRD